MVILRVLAPVATLNPDVAVLCCGYIVAQALNPAELYLQRSLF